jgi:hypothetical protein
MTAPMLRQLPVVVLLAVFASDAGASGAGLELTDSSAVLTQTSDTEWVLEKTGFLDVSGGEASVEWTIEAFEEQTEAGLLVLSGQMTVSNDGSEDATIGNIVVNLQERVSHRWVSASADVADATGGDAATSANIHAAASSEGLSTFTENAASGELEFMDATNNTVWSLVPQKLIAPGATVPLLFQVFFR